MTKRLTSKYFHLASRQSAVICEENWPTLSKIFLPKFNWENCCFDRLLLNSLASQIQNFRTNKQRVLLLWTGIVVFLAYPLCGNHTPWSWSEKMNRLGHELNGPDGCLLMTCRAWQSAWGCKVHLEARTGQTIKHPLLPDVGGMDPSKKSCLEAAKSFGKPWSKIFYWILLFYNSFIWYRDDISLILNMHDFPVYSIIFPPKWLKISLKQCHHLITIDVGMIVFCCSLIDTKDKPKKN